MTSRQDRTDLALTDAEIAQIAEKTVDALIDNIEAVVGKTYVDEAWDDVARDLNGELVDALQFTERPTQ